jgi:hypothetical protein
MRVVHGGEMGFAAVTVVVACLYWVRVQATSYLSAKLWDITQLTMLLTLV